MMAIQVQQNLKVDGGTAVCLQRGLQAAVFLSPGGGTAGVHGGREAEAVVTVLIKANQVMTKIS
jgi:hypothetical protein